MSSAIEAGSAAIEGWAREFLAAPRFATLATIEPDGWPLQAVVWYALHEDGILVNSALGRRWPTDLQRDPRTSLLVEDGYRYVAVRALAEPHGDPEQAQADISALARRYLAPDEAERLITTAFRTQHRISFLLRPTSVAVRR